MKSNYIHVCFVIDESGSMGGSESDVIGGFKRVIDEQKAIKDGTCSVSLFKFATDVTEVYIGKDVNEIDYLDGKYAPGGMTAMNDGIGTAIDKIGKWLDAMKEEEKPEKNLIVVMTDGFENNSKEYTLEKVKDMIKHQEDKYNWTFMYLGTDITDATVAKSYGFTNRGYSSKDNVLGNYDVVNLCLSSYRTTVGDCATKAVAFADTIATATADLTEEYESTTGIKVDNN